MLFRAVGDLRGISGFHCLGLAFLRHTSLLPHIGLEKLYVRLLTILGFLLKGNYEFPPF